MNLLVLLSLIFLHICQTFIRRSIIINRSMQTSMRSQPDFRYDEIHIHMNSSLLLLPRLEESLENKPVQVEADSSDQEMVRLSFFVKGEFHQMQRQYFESMKRCLFRFSKTCLAKLQPKSSKKAYKKTPKSQHNHHVHHEESSIEVFDRHGNEVDLEGKTVLDFETGMKIQLKHDVNFHIIVNPPVVTTLSAFPHKYLTVQCPIVPNIVIEFADDFQCLWYQSKTNSSENITEEFELVSEEKIFFPKTVDRKLKLYVTPYRTEPPSSSQQTEQVSLTSEQVQVATSLIYGRTFIFHFHKPVQELENSSSPSRSLELREEYVQLKQSNSASSSSSSTHRKTDSQKIRIVTYNVLSDGYASQEDSKTRLYYYCNPLYLELEYRLPRVALELLSYQADIIALQECDKKIFEQYLLPLLGAQGYAGHYTNKITMINEGCALFTKKDLLEVIEYIDLPYKKIFTSTSRDSKLKMSQKEKHRFLPLCEKSREMGRRLYEARPDLQDVLGGKLGTIGQIGILQLKATDEDEQEEKQDRVLIIGNTHLFYHPLANYLRLLQVHALLSRMQEIVLRIEQVGLSWEGSDKLQSVRELFFHEEYDAKIDSRYLELQVNRASALLSHDATQEKDSGTSRENGKRNIACSVIVLGDLNSTPGTAALEYLQTGKVTPELLEYSWQRLQSFAWNSAAAESSISNKGEVDMINVAGTDEAKGPIPLSEFQHSFHLQSVFPRELIEVDAKKQQQGKAKFFTNFVVGFQDVLDYIFVDTKTIAVESLAPMPNVDELSREVALPSSNFPSDHVSVVVDIRLL